MNINIRISKKYIDVYLGESISDTPMKLMVEIKQASNNYKIIDILGGGQNTKYHRKGLGTAMVYYLLSYLNKKYGPDVLISRTEIYDESDDTASTREDRRSFWNKFGLNLSSKSNIGQCLAEMEKNNILVNEGKFFLASTYNELH